MANETQPRNFQERMEINVWAMLIVLAIALSIGGIVEIVPLFTMKKTMEHNQFPEIVWEKAGAEPIGTWPRVGSARATIGRNRTKSRKSVKKRPKLPTNVRTSIAVGR